MNTCTYYTLLLSRNIDNDLNDSEKKELQAHIDTCKECAALSGQLSKLHTHLKNSAGTIALPDDETATDTILTSIIAVPDKKIVPFRKRSILAIAASIVCLLGISVFIGKVTTNSVLSPLSISIMTTTEIVLPLSMYADLDATVDTTVSISQYYNVNTTPLSTFETDNSLSTDGFGYSSPLFNEQSLDNLLYNSKM